MKKAIIVILLYHNTICTNAHNKQKLCGGNIDTSVLSTPNFGAGPVPPPSPAVIDAHATGFFTARQYAYPRSLLSSGVCRSVCLSVWHVGGLYSHGWRYRQTSLSTRYPDHSITLFFGPLRQYPIPRGIPSAEAQNTPGWEKLPIFDWNRRLSRKRCAIGPWLLWNVNRKS